MIVKLAGPLLAMVLLLAMQRVASEEVVAKTDAVVAASDSVKGVSDGDWTSVLGCVFKDEVSRCLQQRTMKAMRKWLETERVITPVNQEADAKQDEDQPDKDKGLLDQIGEFFSFGVSRFLQFVDDGDDDDKQEVEEEEDDAEQDDVEDEGRSVVEDDLNTTDTGTGTDTDTGNDTEIYMTQLNGATITSFLGTIYTHWKGTNTSHFFDTVALNFNETDTFRLNGTDITYALDGDPEGRHITQWAIGHGEKVFDKMLEWGFYIVGDDDCRKKKKIRKLKALIKILLLAKLIKEKIYLTLAKLGFLLQVKFFGVAVLNLLVNVGRLFFAWLKHKAPQKVIYYEHANHQHHYEHEHHHDYEHDDKKGWFGSLWSRSFETPKADAPTAAASAATPYVQDYSVQGPQYYQNGQQYGQNSQQYGQEAAYAGQKPQVRYRVVSQGHDDDDD